jgi:ubiquinone/menaquinone biosynthesis C-methylase UbiE
MKNYISTIYSLNRTPRTNYPDELISHLCKRFKIEPEQSLLDIATGRGDFLLSFLKKKIRAVGCDISPMAGEVAKLENPNAQVLVCNVATESFPYQNNSFDFIFNKSILEHLISPENFFNESYRILKPGGTIICMVPDWESNMKIYFDDFTHKTPYTTETLRDALSIFGFENIKTEKFKQLPVTWNSKPINLLSNALSPFIPHRTKIKFLRWSKELMVLGSGQKPHA